MSEIKLTKGYVALVDDDDFEELNKYHWQFADSRATAYGGVGEDGKKKRIYMHRLVTNCPKGMQVDHINHNMLDNRKSNLRICTHKENMMNRPKVKNNTSGYTGVTWHKQWKKWMASISVNGGKIHLGYFSDKEEAAKAFKAAAKKYRGEFVSP